MRLLPTFSEKAMRGGKCPISGLPQAHSNPADPTSPLTPVVDLGLHIDYEGDLEITYETAVEIGHTIGMLNPEDSASLRAHVADLERALAETEEALQAKESAVSVMAGEIHSAAEHARAEYERGYGRGYAQAEEDMEK